MILYCGRIVQPLKLREWFQYSMLPILLLILSVTVIISRSEKALLLDLKYGDFEELEQDPNAEYSRLLTACPASTRQEKEFDENVSFSGNSLFSRELYPKKISVRNIQMDVCNRPFKPAMIYNSAEDKYEIGYEIYYNDRREIGFDLWNDSCYRNYKSVKNINNLSQYKIIDQKIPLPDFVIKYESSSEEVKFNLTKEDGSRTLRFFWKHVLDIISSAGYNKRTLIFPSEPPFVHSQPENCHGYELNLENDNVIYSEKNQEIYLKDILIEPSLSETTPETQQVENGSIPKVTCGQAYGCLENSQIIPLQYFEKHAERIASCSHINMIPVWKTIADGQLKKVDLFTMAVDLDLGVEKIFGVSGILKMKKTTHTSSEPQEIYLSDPENSKIIPVPNIIYRIIEYVRLRRLEDDAKPSQWERYRYAAAIIIHNNPAPISDDERLCAKESILSGWDKICNEDPTIGVTYVCPVTIELNEKLSAYENFTSSAILQPLNLNAVPCSYNVTHYDPTDRIDYQDHIDDVDRNYETLLVNEMEPEDQYLV